jgi:hypothetical protein
MSWIIPQASDVMSEFTPSEQKSIVTLIGGDPDNPNPLLSVIVTRVADEIRDYIRSGGYALDDNEAKIPSGLLNDLISIARWRFLVAVPQLKQLQTDERHALYVDAMGKMKLISTTDFVPDPTDDTLSVSRTGMWNAENKILMRGHPVPPPGTQFPQQTGTYANPDAPQDIGSQP